MSLAKEGERRNIKVNSIAPLAGTRMTETVMPKELVEALKPEYVAPLIGVLCHESCPESGSLFEVGAGYICKNRWQRSEGVLFPIKDLTPENIRQNWDRIVDFTNGTFPTGNQEMMEVIVKNIETGGAPAKIEPQNRKVETPKP